MGWASYQEDIHSRYFRGRQSVDAAAKSSDDISTGGAPAPTSSKTAAKSNKFTLKDFTVPTARPLPVIVLADVSGSMKEGGKIEALNLSIREMIRTFGDEDSSRSEIHIGVVAFGKNGATLHQPLRPAADIDWKPLSAEGKTPMGAAIELATEILEDRAQVPSRAYRPALVLVSDGQPTDDWNKPLEQLLSSERASKALRCALAIGDDADTLMLGKFIGAPGAKVLLARDAAQIKRFFEWVTMSVSVRSRSIRPDEASIPEPPTFGPEDY